ncbi:unnamed protein product [Linum trigynum]|uniref:Uncharacterized protein n=1 Tax=Linum trigynum TaxID=586398 RepID=A0AAV2G741_9ROSI
MDSDIFSYTWGIHQHSNGVTTRHGAIKKEKVTDLGSTTNYLSMLNNRIPTDVQEFQPYNGAYPRQHEVKSQLELLVEKFASDNDQSYSKPTFPTSDPPYSDFLYEAEEIRKSTENLNSMVDKACAQFTQDRLLAGCEEKEYEEASLEDELERSEVVIDVHHDAQELECPLEVVTTLPHFISSVEEEDLHEEMGRSNRRHRLETCYPMHACRRVREDERRSYGGGRSK